MEEEKILKLITKYSVKLLILELGKGKFRERELYKVFIFDLKKQVNVVVDDMELIIDKVRTFYKLPKNYAYIKSQKREFVQGRQIAMYFAYEMTKLSLEKIGNVFNGKKHCTVLHSKKTVKNLIDTDKKIKSDILYIRKEILKSIKNEKLENLF